MKWKIVGELPKLDPRKASENDRGLFTEDLLIADNDNYSIDIGWIPQADLSGEFVCEVFSTGESFEAIESFRSPNPDKVKTWFENKLIQYGA